ncbi:MAG TPA: ISL3 family transposase, partial [Dehalococcoidia bacterium]|nr:ISL3 family transposase [Dehalococcoidia bacterium]
PKWAHRTTTATQALLHLAQAAGGEAGARLAKQLGLPTSPDTLLRLLRWTDLTLVATPRIWGVDDLALRKGCNYATLLVNLETHRPVDLLQDRTADILATWLKDHPGVEVIVRDRSGAYAEGARAGAPQANQVADRFHLLQNASAALVEMLKSRRRRIEYAAPATLATPPRESRPLSPNKQQAVARRASRGARWEEVHRQDAEEWSIRRIARELDLHRRTIRYLLASGEPPRNRVERPRPGGLSSPLLQPYVAYLQDRWQEGCTNASQLFRELVALGYPGSRTLLAEAVRPWRPPRPPPGTSWRTRRVRVRWLCLRPPEQLSSDEQAALERLLGEDPELATGYGLLQRFRGLMAVRDVAALEGWLGEAQTSNLAPFMALANGIMADRSAVEAALRLSGSNGPVEGHVHRVKLLKRQGYGRAKLDLLRRRVLAAA